MTLIIHDHVDLLPYNTFHFSCVARYFVEITSPEELGELINHPLYQSVPQKLILGGGSNILFAKETYDGLVIKNNLLGKKIIQENDQEVCIEVGAGEQRDAFVRRTIDQGRTGLENLVSIPGTVGATPVQNIGAYGVEAKDTIVGVTWTNMKTGESMYSTNEACNFGYRTSVFKNELHQDAVITSVQFRLAKYNEKYYIGNVNYEGVASLAESLQTKHPEKSRLRCVATAIAQIRASKLPDVNKIGTAGSFFQNPVVPLEQYTSLLVKFPQLKGRPVGEKAMKLSAGQLIELVGFKGHRENNVGVYEHHALVLVHHGDGKGAYLLEVINAILDKVQETFTIQLHPEVNIIL